MDNNSQKKILFIDHDEFHSGSTVSLIFLIKKFYDDGYQVHVLTSKNDSNYSFLPEKKILIHRGRWLKYNPFFIHMHSANDNKNWNLTIFKQTLKDLFFIGVGVCKTILALQKLSPDIVYVNEYVAVSASIGSKLMGTPCVLHVRSPFLKGKFGIRHHVLAKLILFCHKKIFAISSFESQQISKDKRPNQLFVIGEFLDKKSFETSNIKIPQDTINIDQNISILNLGGIHEIKGTLTYLQAAEKILTVEDGFNFILAGPQQSDSYYYECKKIINRLLSTNKFQFLGVVKDSLSLIASSDILVSSNKLTHFSRPIIEAWAQKKAVVGTSTDHNRLLVDNNENGLLTNIEDPEDMAVKILFLKNNPNQRLKMGLSGYQKAFEYFNADKNAKFILDKCNKLI